MNGKRRTHTGKGGAVKARITDERQLPDFIFNRDITFASEGLLFRGLLITDIPRSQGAPSATDEKLIANFTEELAEAIRQGTDIGQATIWRDGDDNHGIVGPFPIPMDLIRDRARRCIVLEVRTRKDFPLNQEGKPA